MNSTSWVGGSSLERARLHLTTIFMIVTSWLAGGAGQANAATAENPPPRLMKLHEGTKQEIKYLGIVLVSDSKMVADRSGASNARARARALLDAANRVLEKADLVPRVRLALVDYVSWEADPYTLESSGDQVDATELLLAFNSWASGASLPTHDVHLLLTGLNLSGADVGVTALGGACLSDYNGLVVQDGVSPTAPAEQTLVHEVGHLLGMKHDGADNECASSGYLMSATAVQGGLATPRFSDCSRAEFDEFLANSYASRCTADVPTLVTSGMCGDAVRSDDEACDCGDTASCEGVDPCCRPDCSLAAPATCSRFNNPASCCSESCQVAAKGEACRSARDTCDTAETCTGISAHCPGDGWPRSGVACTDAAGASGACFRGSCATRTAQCVEVAGEVGVELEAPRAECLDADAPCGEAVCWYVATNSCLPAGRDVSDGISCGASSQCSSGACTPSSEIDECPDSVKTVPGQCGCDEPDGDKDGDGVLDCMDACPSDPNKLLSGSCGCGVAESAICSPSASGKAGAPGKDGGETPGDGGCSCAVRPTASSAAWWMAFFGACALLWARRRTA